MMPWWSIPSGLRLKRLPHNAMKELFEALRDAIARGEDAVLCTIVASSGSTPRGSGARMAVFADGTTRGTVGGGAVEHESIALARKALARRCALTQGFHLAPNQVADIGMVCGGQVVVAFQFFAGGDAAAQALFSYLAALFQMHRDAWLVTKLANGVAVELGVYTREEGLLFAEDIPEAEILPLLGPRVARTQGEPCYCVEPLTRAGFVYVFGGGHVSQALVPVLSKLEFSIVVYEDRERFASHARFPDAARILVAPFAEAAARVSITPNDYAVIMTRGHQADFEVLVQMLRTPASYIGMIGSRHKIAATHARLLAAGIPEAEFARIHSPIGLPIGAETPEEIAISIAAELIAHRANARRGEA